MFETCISPLLILQIFISAFFAILFLQSGFDKVFDWSGNYSFLKNHFEKSPLKNLVAFMLGTITAFEVFAGVFSVVGIFALVFAGSKIFGIYGLIFSGISLLCLFFGQRMAKDYAGAAAIVPYFILVVFGIYLFV